MLYLWKSEGEHSWCWCENTPTQTTQWVFAGAWAQLVEQVSAVASKDVMLFCSTSEVLLLEKNISAAQLRAIGDKGVPYLIEEYAITPVDQLVIRSAHQSGQAVVVRSEAGTAEAVDLDTPTEAKPTLAYQDRLSMIAMPQFAVQSYSQLMQLAGLKLVALLPDFLLLPVPTEPNLSHAMALGHSVLIRHSLYSGNLLDNDLLADAYVHTPQMGQLIRWVKGADASAAIGLLTQVGHETDAIEMLPPTAIKNSHPFNLQTIEKSQTVSTYFKYVAAAMVLAILSSAIANGLKVWHQKKIVAQVHANSEQVFKQWFPEESVKGKASVTWMKKRAEIYLKDSASDTTDGVVLLAKAGPVISQNRSIAKQVDFQNDVLSFTVQSPDQDTFDQLKTALSDAGLKAEVGATQANAGSVTGEITVQPIQ